MLALGSALVALVAVVGGLFVAVIRRTEERARAARSPRAVFIACLLISPDSRAREYARVLAARAPRPGETYVDLNAGLREYVIAETGTAPIAITPRYHPVRR